LAESTVSHRRVVLHLNLERYQKASRMKEIDDPHRRCSVGRAAEARGTGRIFSKSLRGCLFLKVYMPAGYLKDQTYFGQ
jgi:hypothetical protein